MINYESSNKNDFNMLLMKMKKLLKLMEFEQSLFKAFLYKILMKISFQSSNKMYWKNFKKWEKY